MNPLTQIKNTQKATKAEIQLGLSESASWHARFKHSAYVFIGGLDYDLTEGDVLAVFAQCGEIVDLHLVRDKQTGRSRGFAFLAYEDQRSTVLAVDNLSGSKVAGRIIRVEHVDNYRKKRSEIEGEDPLANDEFEAWKVERWNQDQHKDGKHDGEARGKKPEENDTEPVAGGGSMHALLAEGARIRRQREAEQAAKQKQHLDAVERLLGKRKEGDKKDKKDKKAKKAKKEEKRERKREKKKGKQKAHDSSSGSDSSSEKYDVAENVRQAASFGPPKPPTRDSAAALPRASSFGPPKPPSRRHEAAVTPGEAKERAWGGYGREGAREEAGQSERLRLNDRPRDPREGNKYEEKSAEEARERDSARAGTSKRSSLADAGRGGVERRYADDLERSRGRERVWDTDRRSWQDERGSMRGSDEAVVRDRERDRGRHRERDKKDEWEREKERDREKDRGRHR